jgi:small GTP-binding protein
MRDSIALNLLLCTETCEYVPVCMEVLESSTISNSIFRRTFDLGSSLEVGTVSLSAVPPRILFCLRVCSWTFLFKVNPCPQTHKILNGFLLNPLQTAGQERFRSVTRSYYRGAAGALLVYDSTSRESFNTLSNWLNDTRTLASPHIIIILVGNKKDLEEAREVTFLEASNFAQENDLIFLETSAKTGENVEESFLKCAKTILAKIETGEIDPETIGSGIQFSDQAIRNNIQNRQKQSSSCAGCSRP